MYPRLLVCCYVSGRWECPWHQCDLCSQEAASFCEMCPSSYCVEHRDGMLFISKLDGRLSCSEHDPCGPEPLEPGEIREFIPETLAAYPTNVIKSANNNSTLPDTDVTPQVLCDPSSSPVNISLNCAYSPISSYEDDKEEDLMEVEEDSEGERNISQDNVEQLKMKEKTQMWVLLYLMITLDEECTRISFCEELISRILMKVRLDLTKALWNRWYIHAVKEDFKHYDWTEPTSSTVTPSQGTMGLCPVLQLQNIISSIVRN